MNLQSPEASKWSYYDCLSVTMNLDINSFLRADLARTYPECQQGQCNYGNYLFTRIQFTASENFWIDDFYIAGQILNGENQFVKEYPLIIKYM